MNQKNKIQLFQKQWDCFQALVSYFDGVVITDDEQFLFTTPAWHPNNDSRKESGELCSEEMTCVFRQLSERNASLHGARFQFMLGDGLSDTSIHWSAAAGQTGVIFLSSDSNVHESLLLSSFLSLAQDQLPDLFASYAGPVTAQQTTVLQVADILQASGDMTAFLLRLFYPLNFCHIQVLGVPELFVYELYPFDIKKERQWSVKEGTAFTEVASGIVFSVSICEDFDTGELALLLSLSCQEETE